MLGFATVLIPSNCDVAIRREREEPAYVPSDFEDSLYLVGRDSFHDQLRFDKARCVPIGRSCFNNVS